MKNIIEHFDKTNYIRSAVFIDSLTDNLTLVAIDQ